MEQRRVKLTLPGALGLAIMLAAGCGVNVHPYPQTGDGAPALPGGDAAAGVGGTGGGATARDAGMGGMGMSAGGASGSGGRRGGGGRGGGSGTGGSSGGAGNTGAGGNGGGGGNGGSPDGPTPTPAVDMAPASGAGVMIGGRFVPREKAIVFIHVGHSDMAGRADGPANLRPFMFETHPQLFVYGRGGTFRAAQEPTAGDSGSAGKSGPGMALLRTALQRAPDAHFISIGHGHSGAQMGYCPNFRKGQLIWSTFMDAAAELKGKVTFAGLFTMFGITEYHLGPSGLATTGDCILGLANDVRAELGVPDLPLMVGGWNEGGTGIYAPDSDYGRVVRPQLEMIPARDPRAGFIPTSGLGMIDDRHLNMAGQKLWAERALMIMATKGFLPWATTP